MNDVLYITQVVKNLLVVLSILSKVATMGDIKDDMNIKKNGVNMIIDARKVKHYITMF